MPEKKLKAPPKQPFKSLIFRDARNLPCFLGGCSMKNLPKMQLYLDAIYEELRMDIYQDLSWILIYELDPYFKSLCDRVLKMLALKPGRLRPDQIFKILFPHQDEHGNEYPALAWHFSHPDPLADVQVDDNAEMTTLDRSVQHVIQALVNLDLCKDLAAAEEYAETHTMEEAIEQIERKAAILEKNKPNEKTERTPEEEEARKEKFAKMLDEQQAQGLPTTIGSNGKQTFDAMMNKLSGQ